eukprot:3037191-Rhodomonas_salina.2
MQQTRSPRLAAQRLLGSNSGGSWSHARNATPVAASSASAELCCSQLRAWPALALVQLSPALDRAISLMHAPTLAERPCNCIAKGIPHANRARKVAHHTLAQYRPTPAQYHPPLAQYRPTPAQYHSTDQCSTAHRLGTHLSTAEQKTTRIRVISVLRQPTGTGVCAIPTPVPDIA